MLDAVKMLIAFFSFKSSTSKKLSNCISPTFVNQILKEWDKFCLTVGSHLWSVHQNPHLFKEPQLEQFISAFFSSTGKLSGKQSNQSNSTGWVNWEAQSI